ncbi:MAG TPA: YihY/virulence factor BrkB family protein [Rhizomicrobium sp.]|jgi:membrane protein|nr:YihY/virulence factor BrkB family protein [Rhizomicrobium sp.]
MPAHLWKLFREGVGAFIADEALSRGAAIAFYAVTALAPVLYISAMLAGLVFGRKAASGALATYLTRAAGPDGAKLVHAAVSNSISSHRGFWPNVLGACILVLTASGLFGEMQTALNAVWRVPSKGSLFARILRDRALSLVLVIALGFLLVGSVLATAAIAALGTRVALVLPFGPALASLLNFAISFALIAGLFAALYKVLPEKHLEWRDVIVGAVGTAVLFELGQSAIGFYLGRSTIGSAYGAAGSLILLLLWIYYSAQIFLLGAEFTKVWSLHHGSQRHNPALEPGAAAVRG